MFTNTFLSLTFVKNEKKALSHVCLCEMRRKQMRLLVSCLFLSLVIRQHNHQLSFYKYTARKQPMFRSEKCYQLKKNSKAFKENLSFTTFKKGQT